MATHCEDCRKFYIKNKVIKGIDGSVAYIPQHKCKLGHKIANSVDGWIPLTNNFSCDDFIKK